MKNKPPESGADNDAARQVFFEIVERSGEAIAVAADDGRYLYRNLAHKALFGRTDIPNEELSVADVMADKEPGQIKPDYWEKSDDPDEWVGLINCVTPEGVKPVWVRSHPMKDPITGDPIRFAFMHDYSDELARMNELVEAKQKAEHAQQTQHGLFHAVSHDLRAILQAASLYLDAADRKAIKQGDKIVEIVRARDAIYSVQDHFQKIIDSLSADSSVFKPKIEYVRGQEILDYTIQTYRALADAKGISLNKGGCDCIFATDVSLMKRIVGNFVSNAIRFTDQGSVDIHCVQIGDRCGIRVSDTGKGIPEKLQEKIFDQFFRIDPDDGDGLGVGLPIAKYLADLLNHKIDLVSSEDSGSVFTISVIKTA